MPAGQSLEPSASGAVQTTSQFDWIPTRCSGSRLRLPPWELPSATLWILSSGSLHRLAVRSLLLHSPTLLPFQSRFRSWFGFKAVFHVEQAGLRLDMQQGKTPWPPLPLARMTGVYLLTSLCHAWEEGGSRTYCPLPTKLYPSLAPFFFFSFWHSLLLTQNCINSFLWYYTYSAYVLYKRLVDTLDHSRTEHTSSSMY